MAIKLKLVKGLSYHGVVTATSANPYVEVDDEKIAEQAVSTGYFKAIETSEKPEETKPEETKKPSKAKKSRTSGGDGNE